MDEYLFIPATSASLEAAAASAPERLTVRRHVMRDFLDKKKTGPESSNRSVRESSENTARSRDHLRGRFRLTSNPQRTRQSLSERPDVASRSLERIGLGGLDPFNTTEVAGSHCVDQLIGFCR